MVATLMVTEQVLDVLGNKPGKQAKIYLAHAREKGLSPVPAPVGVKKLPIRFGKKEQHLLFDGERELKGVELTGLLMAGIEDSLPKEPEVSLQVSPGIVDTLQFQNGRTWRDSQRKMIPQLLNALRKNKVITLEASTGSGKGSGLLGAAILDGRDALVVAPTIKIIRQLVSEYLQFNIEHSFSVVLGKQAYISEILLMHSLEEQSHAVQQEITSWLTKQKSGEVDGVLNVGWLVEDMLQQCPLVSPGYAQSITLNRIFSGEGELSEKDDGFKAWRNAINSRQDDPKIIFATQTMLAADIMLRMKETSTNNDEKNQINTAIEEVKEQEDSELLAVLLKTLFAERGKNSTGLFGERVLYVDEGHLLETNIANFFSQNISLYTLNQLANSSGASNVQNLKQAFSEVVALGTKKDSAENVVVTQGSKERMALSQYVVELKKCVKSITDKSGVGYNTLKLTSQSLSRALTNTSKNNQIYINYSPAYKYPRITYGKSHLGNELSILWGAYTAAAIVSATLSVPEKNNTYIGYTLFIPEEKLVEGESIQSDWLYSDVTMHLPDEPFPYLCRPGDDSEREDDWLLEMAEMIDRIAGQAKGGVLVLCTSYQFINMISNLVNADTYRRLLIQSPNESFEQLENEYRTRNRPVWLATGRAWTGLDLRSDDNLELLTDLVICNIPFGMNRTVSYFRRIARYGFHNTAPYEASILLRQGIGRLKREDDGVHRHIWMLDNRAISGPKASMKQYTIPLKAMAPYKTIEKFKRV